MNDPSKMKHDCSNQKECLQLLQAILDGEATQAQKEHFMKEHLDSCMPCYQNYHLEVAIRDLLKKKCTREAPQELIESIKKQIEQNLRA